MAPSSQIRSIQRLLAKPDLPDAIRVAKEKQLEALQEQQSIAKRQLQEQNYEKRYKLVKFVDHQKAVRRLRQAEKKDASDPEVMAEIKSRKVDLWYIENFPLSEKYISLYKCNDGTDDTTRASRDRRTELWKMAEAGILKKTDLPPIEKKQFVKHDKHDKHERKKVRHGQMKEQKHKEPSQTRREPIAPIENVVEEEEEDGFLE